MAHQEKRAWIMLVVTGVACAAYVVIVLHRANGAPLVDVPDAAPLLWSIGLAIAANIALDVLTCLRTPRSEHAKDARDKGIARIGDLTGQSFLVIGALAAMVLAMIETDYFWITTVVYLGFALSAVLGSATKIAGHRGAFQTW